MNRYLDSLSNCQMFTNVRTIKQLNKKRTKPKLMTTILIKNERLRVLLIQSKANIVALHSRNHQNSSHKNHQNMYKLIFD